MPLITFRSKCLGGDDEWIGFFLPQKTPKKAWEDDSMLASIKQTTVCYGNLTFGSTYSSNCVEYKEDLKQLKA
jgi:hypothetical protein